MKRIEFVFGGTAALAILLKFLHLPFSAMLLLVSISALAVVYMGFGATLFNAAPVSLTNTGESNSDLGSKRQAGTQSIGFAFALVLIGILFKMQQWPMAKTQLMVGLIALAVLFVFNLSQNLKAKTPINKGLAIRVGLIGGIGLILLIKLQLIS
jgi:hypothetical protein